MRGTHIGMAALAAGLIFTQANAETIKFGGILPLTGPGALIGTAEMRGVQFAVDQANAKGGVHGNKIEVQFEDNQAKPDQSILSFNKLTDLEHVSVIFTGYSGPSLAMAPLATRKKVLLVNAGAQADALAKASPYLINTLPTIGGEIEVISRWAVEAGKKKAAILFENGAAGMAGRDDYLKSYADAGGTILAQEATQFGQTDFRPALLKIADAKPDVMLVVITAGLLQMAQEYKQLDLKFTVAGTTFFADPSVIADPAATGFVHTQLRIDAPPELAAQFKAKVRRRHGVLREAVLQRRAGHPDHARQGAGREQARHRRVNARHPVPDRQIPRPDPAGIQDQHRQCADGHQRDA